jgi:glycosidase
LGKRTVAAQAEDERSTLSLYRAGLAARRASTALREGRLVWEESPPGSLVFSRETEDEAVVCAVNVDADAFEPPEGQLLLASEAGVAASLAHDTAAWIRLRR